MSAVTVAPSRLAVLVVFVALTLVWGSTWAVIRISLEGFPPFLGVSLRFAIAAVVLYGIGRAVGVPFGRSKAERWLWVSNALLSFSASYGVVYWSEQHIPSGLAAIIFATFPLFVVVLSHFHLPEERLNRQSALGVSMGFLGLVCIYSEDLERLGGPEVATASLVMLISPLASAVSNVLVKRFGHDVHPISMAAIPMGMCGIIMGGVAGVFERQAPVTPTLGPVLALLYLALAGSAFTFSFYYWLLRHLSAVRVSLIAYTTPIIAVFIGVFGLDEPVTFRLLLGGAIVISGVVVTSRRGRDETQGTRS